MGEADDFAASLAAAITRHQAGDLDQAEAAYRRLIAGHPDQVAPLVNLAAIQRRRAAPEEALDLLQKAVGLAPTLAAVRRNLGNLLHEWGRLPEAAAAYRETLVLDTTDREAKLGLARTLLSLGQFAEGWRMLDARQDRKRAVARGLSGPEWRGEPLAGKRLLIWPEQGFGDQIIMMRYLPRLDGEVTLVCMPQLLRLFADLPATLLPHAAQLPEPAYDYWTLPFSLPLWLDREGDGPPTAPYLTGEGARSGGVGVVWRGNALPDPGRSLPQELAAELLAMPGAVSLQPEDSGALDFKATADRIAGLDLVVSIDTSVAHLAGAMGKPALVLLKPRPPEWRWRTDDHGRSVWYPSVQTITQPRQGDWREVIEQVKARWPT